MTSDEGVNVGTGAGARAWDALLDETPASCGPALPEGTQAPVSSANGTARPACANASVNANVNGCASSRCVTDGDLSQASRPADFPARCAPLGFLVNEA